MKKTNQFVSSKFGNIQQLDILYFLGGATNLDTFLNAYQTMERKGFLLKEKSNQPDNMNHTEVPAKKTSQKIKLKRPY